MINKIELLNEILENNPELEGEKEKIEELISLLIDNNPDIKVDKIFKKNLKNKIDTVIWMEDKSIRKLSLFTAFIQVFSLAFVVWGLYYSFDQIDFFNKDNSWQINISENIQIQKRSSDILEKSNNIKIEDTQIIDLLWEPEKKESDNIRMLWEPMMMKSTISIQSDLDIEENPEAWISSFWDAELLMDESEMMFDETESVWGKINNFEQKLSFEEYCSDNYWDIINLSWVNICIVEGKQCIEDDYDNGICNFIQIK